jgi:hypothetical protein
MKHSFLVALFPPTTRESIYLLSGRSSTFAFAISPYYFYSVPCGRLAGSLTVPVGLSSRPDAASTRSRSLSQSLSLAHPPPPPSVTRPPHRLFVFLFCKNVTTFGACVCVTIVIPSASLCVSVIACPLRSSAATFVQ